MPRNEETFSCGLCALNTKGVFEPARAPQWSGADAARATQKIYQQCLA